eukprot:6003244-Karenia_brevis.AAC.1
MVGSRAQKEPMPVRYSGSRLDTSCHAKRLCLSALHSAFTSDSNLSVELEDLRQYSTSLEQLS